MFEYESEREFAIIDNVYCIHIVRRDIQNQTTHLFWWDHTQKPEIKN